MSLLIKPAPINLECSTSFFGFPLPFVQDQLANQQLVSQGGDQRNGPWEQGIHRGNLNLAINVYVVRWVVLTLDASGLYVSMRLGKRWLFPMLV